MDGLGEAPVVVLVHGEFAESASWHGVIRLLREQGLTVLAVANPLRSLSGDAAYVRDLIAGLGRPVVLVGHSYGGMVITQAAVDNTEVRGLVYVSAFAPEPGDCASLLAGKFGGTDLGSALVSTPLSGGGTDLLIDLARFAQFADDLDPVEAVLLAHTQRPITAAALDDEFSAAAAPWTAVPSWHIWGENDFTIPAAGLRFMADRADARASRELPGASHALPLSRPREVTSMILDAVRHVRQ